MILEHWLVYDTQTPIGFNHDHFHDIVVLHHPEMAS